MTDMVNYLRNNKMKDSLNDSIVTLEKEQAEIIEQILDKEHEILAFKELLRRTNIMLDKHYGLLKELKDKD